MPVLGPFSIECTSHSDEQTQRLGARLGASLPRHAIIALHGPLGAGKTSFARGIGAGWGADQPLRSPTFTLVQEHRRAGDDARLYHIDLYRATNESDLASLGLEEIFDDEDSVCLIEWPERIARLIPDDAIHVKLDIVSDTRRQLTISTQDPTTWQVLLTFRKSAFGI